MSQQSQPDGARARRGRQGNRQDARLPRYSVIVPCYNEAESVPALAKRLEMLSRALRTTGSMEVVLVDDGSTDDTAGIARNLFSDWEFFSVVRHQTNLGLGLAMTTGIGMAMGQIVCTIDADGTYDPLILVDLIERIESGADLATASPYHPDGQVDGVGRYRLFLSRGLSRIYSTLFARRLYTYTSCLRAYRQEVARRSLPVSAGFLAVAEMLCLALLQGYSVVEVPARLSTRVHGQSKMRVGREILHHLRNLAQIYLRSGPYAGVTAR